MRIGRNLGLTVALILTRKDRQDDTLLAPSFVWRRKRGLCRD